MTYRRIVVPEALDGLDAHDPAAQHSRRDLQRIHRIMGTRTTILRALRKLSFKPSAKSPSNPLRILELGAGDGSLMLRVARALHNRWPPVELTLLDRQHLLTPATIADYAAVGWSVKAQVGDVLDWAADPEEAPRWNLIVSNLFLHHFHTPQLRLLLAAVAARTEYFFACEPRRSWLACAGSHLVGALGANAVTREDAVLSVHAGFRDAELRSLWPARASRWNLSEYPAGPFSHCLVAARTGRKPIGGA